MLMLTHLALLLTKVLVLCFFVFCFTLAHTADYEEQRLDGNSFQQFFTLAFVI